ncbi:FERM domain-containing protein 5-like [Anneissia japonica]|uniref:FERM domain-containing protein 5-like n=1 Tax=Anneissia japonica TaxID=1529436 RepID=UPI001425A4FB|nr:FERM domain-containing protein 5-like [Anneissia japonica]
MNRFQCTVRRLEEQAEPLVCSFEKDVRGQVLLDYVIEKLNIVERDYFSLRFMDGEKQRHWIDPTKNIVKQMKGGPPYNLVFRVKFYPSNPQAIKEGITRYHLFLQLCRDLQHGRLLCNKEDSVILAGYIIQANIGDYDLAAEDGYVSKFKLVSRQSSRFEKKVENQHRCLRGLSAADAEEHFINKAHTLLTYGVDPHPVRDIYGTLVYIGMTYRGLSLLKGRVELQHFPWKVISRLSFDGRTFYISAVINERKVVHRFRSETSAASKHLWKCAVDHQAFFKFERSKDVSMKTSGSLFRGTRFKFSGRTQHEVLEQSANITREEPIFARSPPMVKPRRTKSFMDHLYTSDVHTYDGFSQMSDSNHSTPKRFDNQLMSYPPVTHECIEESTTLSDDLSPPSTQDACDGAVPNNYLPAKREARICNTDSIVQPSRMSILVKIVLCFLVSIFVLSLCLIVLFEADSTNLSAVRDFRSLHCIEDFHIHFYMPSKQSIVRIALWFQDIVEPVRMLLSNGSISIARKLHSVLFSGFTESSS